MVEESNPSEEPAQEQPQTPAAEPAQESPPPPEPAQEATATPKLSKTQAAKLLKADLANLVKKVTSGRTLSTAERQMLLQFQRGETEDGIQGPADGWASSKVELAEALGVTRQTIDEWGAEEGCPGARSNGTYNIPEWRAWCEQRGKRTGSKTPNATRLRADNLLLQNAMLEFKLAIMRREYVPASDVEVWVADMVTQAKKVLLQIPAGFAPQVVGVSVPEAEELLREGINDALAQLHVRPMHEVFAKGEKDDRAPSIDDGE